MVSFRYKNTVARPAARQPDPAILDKPRAFVVDSRLRRGKKVACHDE
jgi:hypothetical protein